eukprot:PITA_14199
MSYIIQSEPQSFEEVVKHKVWKDAMIEEYESIMQNDVWEVVPRSQGKSVVTSKWLFKIKHGMDGSIEKYKAIFVARGFFQKEEIDYENTFSLVARYTTIRSIISLAISQGNEPLMIQCKRELASEFEMKDLGMMHFFLGLEVWQRPSEIILSQGKYVVKLLERFEMVECKSMSTPMEMNFKKLYGDEVGPDLSDPSAYRHLIGALMFLVNTRPDICYDVNTLIQFMTKPLHNH